MTNLIGTMDGALGLARKTAFLALLGSTLAVPAMSGVSAVSLEADATALARNVEVKGGDGILPDTAPVLMAKATPKYPPRALEIDREGWVVVEMEIDEAGKPRNPEVVAAGKSSLFNASAVHAIRKFRFEPATLDGKPVAVTGKRYKVVYALQ